jgi:hypothetical protein
MKDIKEVAFIGNYLTRQCGIATLLLTICFSPSFGQQTWTRTYGGADSDVGFSAQQTMDGGYIIAGWTRSFGTGLGDVYLIKTDPWGDTLWTRTYGGPDEEVCYWVQQTADSGYIVAGGTCSYGPGTPTSPNIYLVKTDAWGDTLWTRTYGGEGGDYANCVQQTPDGGYIVTGATESASIGNYDAFLIRTDADGDTLWNRTYGGSSYDGGGYVQRTSDGGYVIAGSTQSFGPGTPSFLNVWLIKTNSAGDTLWTRAYGGEQEDGGHSAQQTWDGGYIISGDTKSYGPGTPTYYNVYLLKTDGQGDTLWTRTYGGSRNDYGYCVRQTADSGYIMAGRFSTATNAQAYLVKTDGNGDTLWTKTYGGTDADWARSVRQAADGGYIIAGQTASYGAGGWDAYLIKTDAAGMAGVEGHPGASPPARPPLWVRPNPFAAFATVPGRETERFAVYDVSGRRVGEYYGARIGNDLASGVYLLRPQGQNGPAARMVKLQ